MPLLDRRVLLGAIAALAASPARAQSQATSVPLRAEFDRFIAAVEERFYLKRRLAEVGFRAKAEALWPQIESMARLADAVSRLNALLAELRLSHTGVFTPDDPDFYLIADVFEGDRRSGAWSGAPPMPTLGFFTRLIDGRHHVVAVLDGTEAAAADVRVGDEVVTIDDAAYAPVAAIAARSAGERVDVGIRRRHDGALSRVSLPVAKVSPRTLLDTGMRASARVIARGNRRIGYVRVWHLRTRHALAEALSLIDGGARRYRDGDGVLHVHPKPGSPARPQLDALIIDNRGRIGGQFAVAQEFLAALRGPLGGSIVYETTPSDVMAPTSFAGRCVMLIDASTRSAGELFAQGFKTEALGPLFGNTTAGAVSGGGIERLAGPLVLYLATSRVVLDGVDLEGVGVTPTHRVERPIPYSAGADPVLEAALAHLARA